MLNELIARVRAVSRSAGALAEVLASLDRNSMPLLVQARACCQLADIEAKLNGVADLLGCATDPQLREEAYA